MISNENAVEPEKFIDRFKNFRKLNKYTDCQFKVDAGVFQAHKLILAACSPVFEAMFYGGMSSNEAIKITDISGNTFSKFIDYAYTGQVLHEEAEEQNLQDLLELYYCGQKYLVDDLRTKCLQAISSMLTAQNVFLVLKRSFEMHLDDLCVLAVYLIHSAMSKGISLANEIFCNPKNHLSGLCFEFLMKNLLDALGLQDNLLCFLKTWCIVECKLTNIEASDDSIKMILAAFMLDERTIHEITKISAVLQEKSQPGSGPMKLFQRVYYKPVTPFIPIALDDSFEIILTLKSFLAFHSISINSRLVPDFLDVHDTCNKTYQDKIMIEVTEKESGRICYSEQHELTSYYNSSSVIKFSKPLALFPKQNYRIKFKFSPESYQFEYPRCVYSLEKNDVRFHEYWPDFGSICNGLGFMKYL